MSAASSRTESCRLAAESVPSDFVELTLRQAARLDADSGDLHARAKTFFLGPEVLRHPRDVSGPWRKWRAPEFASSPCMPVGSVMRAASRAGPQADLKLLAVTVLTSFSRADLDEMGYNCEVSDLVERRAPPSHGGRHGWHRGLAAGSRGPSKDRGGPRAILVSRASARPARARGDQKRVRRRPRPFGWCRLPGDGPPDHARPDRPGELARVLKRLRAESALSTPAKTRADGTTPFPGTSSTSSHSESFIASVMAEYKISIPDLPRVQERGWFTEFPLLLATSLHAHVLGLGRAERQNRQRVPFLDHCGHRQTAAGCSCRSIGLPRNNNDVPTGRTPAGIPDLRFQPVRRSRTTGFIAGYDRRSSSWLGTDRPIAFLTIPAA